MKNGIVIPCYNEAKRLKIKEFTSFANSHNNFTLCFVNDGSKDNTLECLKKLARDCENIIVYDMPENGGKAEAVRMGILHLLSITEVDNVGFIDADLATGFDDYKNLVSTMAIENKAMVIGSRKLDSSLDMNRNKFREIASFVVGKFIHSIVGMKIKDTQCGAKVFSRRIAKSVFAKGFQSKWLFDVEVLIRFRELFGQNRSMNFIKEVALSKWEEVDGSKITLKDSIQFPLQLCQIGFDYNIAPRIRYDIQRITETVLSLGLNNKGISKVG